MATIVCFTLLNIVLLCISVYFYLRSQSSADGASSKDDASASAAATAAAAAAAQLFPANPQTSVEPLSAVLSRPVESQARAAGMEVEVECTDPVWCKVPIPVKSHYKFDTPIDASRWKRAQMQAARGEQVLLEQIVRVFPNHFDYLDGDRSFRRLHSLIDVFVDHKSGLSALSKKSAVTMGIKDARTGGRRRRLAAETTPKKNGADDGGDGEEEISLEKGKSSNPAQEIAGHVDGKRVVPEAYNYRTARRAPIVQMGYFGFAKNLNTFFSGNFVGGNFIKKGDFFREWARLKNEIDVPFITICALNENWGLLSTMFPNRTAAWGQCCDPAKEKQLYDFLAHDKTLLLITNQHNNISHPKLLTIPRGIPLTWQHTAKLMWDTQRKVLSEVKKTKLLFAASSNWGARGQMIRCISSKFQVADFEGHSAAPTIHKKMSQIKVDRRHYYEKLGGTYFGLALPGLGYDCFRTWELLTMGTIVVLERGVGLDRTVRFSHLPPFISTILASLTTLHLHLTSPLSLEQLWRLPALLLDDFADVTPDLLRSAYVEAVYRAKEFEFERLTQSYWYSVITNVSATMSMRPLLDAFPMRAEDANFCRPRVPYPCGKTDTCGPGTKRIPAVSC